MLKYTGKLGWSILGVCLLAAIGTSVLHSTGCRQAAPVAKIEQPQGVVEARLDSGSVFRTVTNGDQIVAGGAVRTGADGETDIVFADGVRVKIWPDSHFSITGGARIGRQEAGSALFKVQPSPVERTIETPTGLTTITGTVFAQEVTSSTFSLFLDEGKVSFTDLKGARKTLTAGQQLLATAGEALTDPTPMDERLRKAIFHPGEFPFNKLPPGSRPFIMKF